MNFSCRRLSRTLFLSKRLFSKVLKTPAYVMEPIEPIVQNLDSQHFRELFTPELLKLNELFREKSYELRIAGGAVRDLLMNIRPADVDFASTAKPDEMTQMFNEKKIRLLHKRGEEHGTITCRIDDKENFEITTLRVDVVCDGRRAKVEYTTDWQLDANRRDLTINSLFLKLDGTVIDYFGGIRDIDQRRVAFVGEARQRIQEDYLRILRYFRFFGRISNSPEHETDTIQAIIENKDGLAGVSAERIWTELKKIVVGRMAGEVVKSMIEECGLQKYLGLPEKCNVERFKAMSDKYGKDVESITMIASLLETEEDVAEFHRITKLSRMEQRLAEFVVKERREAAEQLGNDDWWIDKMMLLEVCPGHSTDILASRIRVLELAKSVMADEGRVEMIRQFAPAKFPITGVDLMEHGVPRGPHVKSIQLYLFEMWKQSRYTMTKAELIVHSTDKDIPEATKEPKRSRSRSQSKR